MITYGRALFSGRDLQPGQSCHKCKLYEDLRVDEIADIANGVRKVHPGNHSTHRSYYTATQMSIYRTYLVPSASRICTLVVGFDWSTSNSVLMLSAVR